MTKQQCIDILYACAKACDECAAACLSEEDVKMMARCIQLDIDCADLCRTSAGFLARESAYYNEVLLSCATVCEACADECEQHSAAHCKRCAQECRKCADACKSVAAK